MKKLESINIRFGKALDKSLYIYHYKGTYFREIVFNLYFLEICFHILYKPVYTENLQWSEEEREILEKQGKQPLKINKIDIVGKKGDI